MTKMRNQFDNVSPVDYRYSDEESAQYLSKNGFTRYKLFVELALVKVLERRGYCSKEIVRQVKEACREIKTEEVYEEEEKIHHDIRALVNRIRARVQSSAVHMTATSYDIIDSANAVRYKDVVEGKLISALLQLERVLILIALREAETIQIGRTHGQHAVPITFGFAIAQYVSRLGGSIKALRALVKELPGKFSGAVGAYNASSLFFDDPEQFEKDVLAEIGLKPAEISTQVVPPEALVRLFCEITIVAGILANLSDDMRHLQRTEIGEVGEVFEENQVGSSTMPQKRNPINFENSKSFWKIVMPRIITIFMDQISEHQRDLTNSASGRTYGEIIAYVISTAKRLTRTMKKLTVDKENLKKNFELTKGSIMAEPLQLILSALGHKDAHEKVRVLAIKARSENKPLQEIALEDMEIKAYFEKMTPRQQDIILNPSLYTGIAAKKAKQVAEHWKEKLEI